MRTQMWAWAVVIGVMFLLMPALSAQEADNPQILSISTVPRLEPPPTMQDFFDAFELAHDAGVNGDVITYQWRELEPSEGVFQLEDFENHVNFIDTTYGYTVMLGIQVLNTTDKETPADLMDVPFDDGQMLARFQALFDALLPHLNENVRYLSIGNEVDVYLEAQQEWEAYQVFYERAVTYVHQAAPWIQVGVTVTYGGAVDHADKVRRLNEQSDVLILTYYPLGEAFMTDDPTAPLADFPRMVEMAGGMPVILQEVGYPSAELLDGSEAEQSEFVRHVFEAWAAAGEAIPLLNYFLLGDLSEQLCTDLEGYYGLAHPNFHAFLCSLGLRYADGTPKQAWQTFMDAGLRWSSS